MVKKSDRVLNFLRRYVTHVKGALGGKPYDPMEWEIDLVQNVYDKLDEDGNRLINFVYIEIPRKNSKTTLLGGLSLYHLIADDEYGAEVVMAASERQQASIMMGISKEMVRQNTTLSNLTKPRAFDILSKDRKSFLKAISSEAASKHGMNISFCAMDELHTWRGRDLYDVLLTSMASRKQPLAIAITTAGEDKSGICWEVHNYCLKVQSGEIIDPHFYGKIYAADEKDKWDDPEVWKKANPGYGLSVNKAYLERKCLEAKNNNALINTFKRLHLNIWVSEYSSWFGSQIWSRNKIEVDEIDLNLEIRTCYGGIDLASTSDFVSLSIVWLLDDDQLYVKNWYWIPAEMADRRVKSISALRKWELDGWLIRTEGNVIDDRLIAADIENICSKYQIDSLAYDKALAHSGVAQDLMKAGLDMHAMSQSIMSMSEPTKKYEKMSRSGMLRNDGNPVTEWMLENCVIYSDANANIKLVKNKAKDKIDGVVAGVMAIGQWMFTESENPESIYAKNDMYDTK